MDKWKSKKDQQKLIKNWMGLQRPYKNAEEYQRWSIVATDPTFVEVAVFFLSKSTVKPKNLSRKG
jgi:hypothetical protein